MKTKVKITNTGGSYYDEYIKDTVYFTIDNSIGFTNYPNEGKNISLDTSDSLGERETGLDGNTFYKWNGNNWVKRETPLTVKQLIREILNLPRI